MQCRWHRRRSHAAQQRWDAASRTRMNVAQQLNWRCSVPVPGENPTPTLRQLQESPLQWMWSRTVEGDCCTLTSFSPPPRSHALGPTTALLRWLKASVSEQVKSYTRERPRAHGTIVRPSGLLPSLRLSDAGSNMAGVSADANARLMRSLTALCLKRRPADLRQAIT